MRRRVGIFGGSFHPPHVAHVLASVYALSVGELDEILVVPVFQHPFAKELVSFEHRMRMCQLAFGWIPGVTVSDVERRLGGESRTLRTLEHLSEAHPDWSMRLVVGSDVVPDIPKWHRFDRIAELAPPWIIERPGAPTRAGALTLAEVSSTEVRGHLAAGRLDAVADRLPHAVLDYIRAERLYGVT